MNAGFQTGKGIPMTRFLSSALVVAALSIPGHANAVSPTVNTNETFRGIVNIVKHNTLGGLLYAVPASKSFMLTDIIVTNATTNTGSNWEVYRGTSSSCSFAASKTPRLYIPAQSTVHFAYVTGIRFSPGQFVCVFSQSNDSSWAINGFLYD
jgi:hypothetical protein